MSIVGPGTGKQLYRGRLFQHRTPGRILLGPTGDGKMAVRGAFGIFHDRVFGNLFGNARGNPPFEQDYSVLPFETIGDAFGSGAFPAIVPNTTPSITIPDYDPFTNVGALAPVSFDPHFRIPVSNNSNFGPQRELPGNSTMDLSYAGSRALTSIARSTAILPILIL